MICEWFALCTNPAAGTVAHPILGAVPCCTRCADKLGLTFTKEKDQVTATVVPYDEEADIAIITYGDMTVAVSRAENGRILVNLERVTDNRVDVEVVIDGNEPIWEGNLS